MRVSILGAGSWASALATVLSDKNEVVFYARREEHAREINEARTNRRYLPSLRFDSSVRAVSDIEAAIEGADVIINAVPTQQTRSVFERLAPIYPDGVPLINVSKGLEQKTGLRISQIFREVCGERPFAVLSGPSHAEEVSAGQPTTVVIASESAELAERLQDLFMRPSFRVYTGDDVCGVEIGGAIKNILALGIGIADGLRYGDNPKAALITRGMHEMVRLGVEMGGSPRTLYGLAGFGDLYVTATSHHSRNRNAGELLGRGHSLQEVKIAIGQVIEGVMTCDAVHDTARAKGIDMPITEAIYSVLYRGASVDQMVISLMKREKKNEFED